VFPFAAWVVGSRSQRAPPLAKSHSLGTALRHGWIYARSDVVATCCGYRLIMTNEAHGDEPNRSHQIPSPLRVRAFVAAAGPGRAALGYAGLIAFMGGLTMISVSHTWLGFALVAVSMLSLTVLTRWSRAIHTRESRRAP
jgi:hypothetical protein